MIDLILAPIRGVTTYSLRNVFVKYFSGFDRAIAFFIPTVSSKKMSKSHMRDILPENNRDSLPLTPQLLSNNANDFIRMANYIYNLGYKTINWNLGCPCSTITNKKRGSGLLPFKDELEQFLDSTIPRLNGSLSIKTRLGLNSKYDLIQLIPLFNRYPIKELIIHPRTGRQLYTGSVDINEFEKCYSLSKIPVVYNGDIVNKEMFIKLQSRFPKIKSWMIGRGALINPFLPALIKDLNGNKEFSILKIKAFHDELCDVYEALLDSNIILLGKMKEIWSYLSLSIPEGKTFLKEILKLTNLKEYKHLVSNFLGG